MNKAHDAKFFQVIPLWQLSSHMHIRPDQRYLDRLRPKQVGLIRTVYKRRVHGLASMNDPTMLVLSLGGVFVPACHTAVGRGGLIPGLSKQRMPLTTRRTQVFRCSGKPSFSRTPSTRLQTLQSVQPPYIWSHSVNTLVSSGAGITWRYQLRLIPKCCEQVPTARPLIFQGVLGDPPPCIITQRTSER